VAPTLAAVHHPLLLAVNPVPWARAQMAFTLAFHIIFVPLGVSWAFMTLIANYRAVKHGDIDALRLAQRWSKYMALTFAVGAVTGTVLSFEFGLLWPRFMGQWGQVFGVPFAFEGLFFLTEAVFVSIYIFGWRRLKPWAHFWTGVPIPLAGVLGSASVVAANAWMNEPSGFTLNQAGKVVSVDPWGVIFNKAMPLMTLHMLLAAYVVGGFLIASVYAAGMLRGRRDRYHRLGFLIPFSVAAVAVFAQMAVGDSLARWVYNNEPVKFAAIELVPTTSSDVPETLLGHLNSNGTVSGGIPIPGLASILSDPSTGTATVVEGLNTVPADDEPTISQVNTVHLAWDVMIGLGTILCLLAAWYWVSWIFRRRMPKSRLFLRAASAAGIAAVITMEAGWTLSEVGRQPWIVYNQMKVEAAATGNTGVWLTFVLVVALYIGLGVTTILVLRGMARRFRRLDATAGSAGSPVFDESDTPYGPSADIDLREGETTESVTV
jgi:cytochrome bd ubiquinol oxidase subunit I